MYRENDIDVVNAKKALQRICENNPKFVFEQNDDDNYLMQVTDVRKYMGDAGSVFYYHSNGMEMGVAISDKMNKIYISSELKEKNEAHWYYEEYQRLYKIASESLNTIKNK
jgi:hypothetical protein